VTEASAKDHGLGAITISSFLPLQDKSSPAAAFQAALKQGIITVVGHRNLGGRDTILLDVKPLTNSKKQAVGKPEFPSADAHPFNEIWLDAATYQVVQTENFLPIVINKKTGKPVKWGTDHITGMSGTFVRWAPVITRVSWLPGTAENLAKLTVTPPHGYTRVPESDMGKFLGPIS
jgi:hypothetical protein